MRERTRQLATRSDTINITIILKHSSISFNIQHGAAENKKVI